jgi:hypothetical protein
MFVKLVLLITFLVHFSTNFLTDSKSARNSAFFDTKKKKLCHISIFSNFKAKRAKNGSKIQKRI